MHSDLQNYKTTIAAVGSPALTLQAQYSPHLFACFGDEDTRLLPLECMTAKIWPGSNKKVSPDVEALRNEPEALRRERADEVNTFLKNEAPSLFPFFWSRYWLR